MMVYGTERKRGCGDESEDRGRIKSCVRELGEVVGPVQKVDLLHAMTIKQAETYRLQNSK